MTLVPSPGISLTNARTWSGAQAGRGKLIIRHSSWRNGNYELRDNASSGIRSWKLKIFNLLGFIRRILSNRTVQKLFPDSSWFHYIISIRQPDSQTPALLAQLVSKCCVVVSGLGVSNSSFWFRIIILNQLDNYKSLFTRRTYFTKK